MRFSKLMSYPLLVGQVVAGVLLLVFVQMLKIPTSVSTFIIFTTFLLLNLFFVRIFNLKDASREYWSLQKLPNLLAGTAVGLLLVVIPIFAAVVVGKQSINSITVDKISIQSFFLTFLIVSWEELWFRSLLLNYCSKYLSKLNISLSMGLLFMLVHTLNPKISLHKDGPELFLAGTLLTILYFYTRNIWLSTGLHFGNNFFGSMIKTDIKDNPLFGNEGYIYTGILLSATLFFLMKLRTYPKG